MRLPIVYGYSEHVVDGGLISDGVDPRECFRRSAVYAHKILTGTAPGDLPLEFRAKLELIINLCVEPTMACSAKPGRSVVRTGPPRKVSLPPTMSQSDTKRKDTRRRRTYLRYRGLTVPRLAVDRETISHEAAPRPAETSERVVLRPLDGDPAKIGEFVDHGLAAETAVAAGFHASERHLGFVRDRRTVDMADAALDAFRHRHGAHDIAPEYRGGETIFGIIGDANGFIDALDANDRLHRSEGFLAVDLHLGLDVVEQGGFDHGAIALAAGDYLCALADGIGDQNVHAFGRREINQRAQHHMTARIAGRQLRRFGG